MARARPSSKSGQTTVEAAFLLPILLLLILLLLQPMILLYNRMIMEGAAVEACRLIATSTTQGAYSYEKYEEYVKRRLAAIPPGGLFHVNDANEGWRIRIEGDEYSDEVTVEITHCVQPVPLMGWEATLMQYGSADGYIVQVARATLPTQPGWVAANGGNDPEGWVHTYD